MGVVSILVGYSTGAGAGGSGVAVLAIGTPNKPYSGVADSKYLYLFCGAGSASPKGGGPWLPVHRVLGRELDELTSLPTLPTLVAYL